MAENAHSRRIEVVGCADGVAFLTQLGLCLSGVNYASRPTFMLLLCPDGYVSVGCGAYINGGIYLDTDDDLLYSRTWHIWGSLPYDQYVGRSWLRPLAKFEGRLDIDSQKGWIQPRTNGLVGFA